VSRAEIAALLEAQRASLIEQNMPPERIRVIEVMIAAFSRSRDTGPNLSESEIESVLCVAGSRPEAALQQICRTSILRDELISELSLDLTDSERAELVHAAIGDPSDADYGARAAAVLSAAQKRGGAADRDYNEVRQRLNSLIADRAIALDAALTMGDIAGATALLDSEFSGAMRPQIC